MPLKGFCEVKFWRDDRRPGLLETGRMPIRRVSITMIKVAIAGFGVVGSGVAELLTGSGPEVHKKADDMVELKYILERKPIEGPLAPYGVGDFAVIEADPEVDVVVETIGGVGAALDFTERALKAGKSVVTSNKELVARHGDRLLALAQEHGVSYRFEASVGGGIPILRPLSECMAANEILEICGILNGTTNYIFTQMISRGLSFETALKQAQENGYAERDPSADVEGQDTCRKVCILASIALGWHVLPEQVPTVGITQVALADAAYAASCGRKVKLLGRAIRRNERDVCAFVEPHMVSADNPLAGVEGVFNAITVKGNATGDVMFYGQGAGKLPTASAVVADVIAVARRMSGGGSYGLWEKNRPQGAISPDTLASRWFVRLEEELPGGELLPPPVGVDSGRAYLTEAMTRPQLNAMLEGKTVLSVIRLLD